MSEETSKPYQPLPEGTYVLATKYSDGESGDDWCVGFIKHDALIERKERHHVVDSEGRLFRGNGFRRAEPIERNEGDYILSQRAALSGNWGISLWKLLAQFRGEIGPTDSLETHACPSCQCSIEPEWSFCATCGSKLTINYDT